MPEPSLFGVPLTLMFLYFIWYSLLGWCMESTYCSIRRHRLINRGFLHLPLCPIYGVGVLIMVNFFTPFTSSPLLFYIMATLVMSAWEYFVGWLLETTTHMKYWDYSDRRFNLKGRICLGNSIWWGVASYLVIYWVHPATEQLFSHLSIPARQILAVILAVLFAQDQDEEEIGRMAAFFTILGDILALFALQPGLFQRCKRLCDAVGAASGEDGAPAVSAPGTP